jgi:hypothetical protein
MQCIAVTAHDLFRLRRLLLERRIVRRKPVIAVSRLDQKKPLSIASLQAIDHFFRQNHSQRISELADLELNPVRPMMLLQL